ncbi:MAG: transposase, partial [Anaerolineales bacterium]
PPHPFREAGYYLITAANFEHAPVMDSADRRTEFEMLLLGAMRGIQAELIAWVILPNHYHMLIDVESLDAVSAALKYLHVKTSRQWNLEDNLTEKRRVWYRFSDRLMRSEKQLHQTFNYIHNNPIKHGYTNDVNEWLWSSFKLYEESNGRDWLQEQWKSNMPPEDFGRGWDD